MTEPRLSDVLTEALDAYARLASLGEDIEDEWTYVTDLDAAWRERLEARGSRARLGPAGVRRSGGRTGHRRDRSHHDPHRAIDWLSTFPQVVLVAAGEQP